MTRLGGPCQSPWHDPSIPRTACGQPTSVATATASPESENEGVAVLAVYQASWRNVSSGGWMCDHVGITGGWDGSGCALDAPHARVCWCVDVVVRVHGIVVSWLPSPAISSGCKAWVFVHLGSTWPKLQPQHAMHTVPNEARPGILLLLLSPQTQRIPRLPLHCSHHCRTSGCGDSVLAIAAD